MCVSVRVDIVSDRFSDTSSERETDDDDYIQYIRFCTFLDHSDFIRRILLHRGFRKYIIFYVCLKNSEIKGILSKTICCILLTSLYLYPLPGEICVIFEFGNTYVCLCVES